MRSRAIDGDNDGNGRNAGKVGIDDDRDGGKVRIDGGRDDGRVGIDGGRDGGEGGDGNDGCFRGIRFFGGWKSL